MPRDTSSTLWTMISPRRPMLAKLSNAATHHNANSLRCLTSTSDHMFQPSPCNPYLSLQLPFESTLVVFTPPCLYLHLSHCTWPQLDRRVETYLLIHYPCESLFDCLNQLPPKHIVFSTQYTKATNLSYLSFYNSLSLSI